MNPQPTLFDPPPDTETRIARRVLAAFESSRGEWLDRIRALARELHATLGRPISADDLRRVMRQHPGLEPPGDNRNAMGAVFRGGWRAVGMIQSETPGSHGRIVRTWEPTDEARAA